VLRDSDIEIEEEAEDLVRLFETALKRRRRGHVIRLEVDAGCRRAAPLPGEELDAGADDDLRVDGMLGSRTTVAADRRGPARPRLHRPTTRASRAHPRFRRRLLRGDPAEGHRRPPPLRELRRRGAVPAQAARDPAWSRSSRRSTAPAKTARSSRALAEAAEAGKSVTALVELKARFDEEANIRWARDLERAGVQVVYGFIELKTHAKVSLVVRREGGALQHLRAISAPATTTR
jgi:polyphosphate kinase